MTVTSPAASGVESRLIDGRESAAGQFSQRVDLTRICMIIGIVYLHCPPYVPIAEIAPGAFNFLKALVQDGLFRATVPVLTVISGYLYFKRFSAAQFGTTVQKKFVTLIVPMAIWNVIIFADYKIVNIMLPNVKIGHDIVWWNAIFSLTDQPINYPTWFLRDLFALALLGIVFDQLLRRAPLPGLLLVAGVFILDLDGKLLLNGSMAVNFYMGGWIARSRVNVLALDRFWLAGLITWVGLSALWIHARLENLTFLHLTMPYCIWPAIAALQRTSLAPRLLKLAPFSFSVFLLHAPVLAVLWGLYKAIDPALALYVVFWLTAPLLAVLGAVIVRLTVLAVSPGLAGVLFGNR